MKLFTVFFVYFQWSQDLLVLIFTVTHYIPYNFATLKKKILSNVWYDYDDLISCMYVNELHRWFSGLCVRLKPKTKIDICICCCSTKRAVLRSKSKYWLARNQVSVSKWSDMSIADCCFSELSTGTIKIQLSLLV